MTPNEAAAETSPALFTRVYQELRRIARSQRRSVGSPATLDTTALVHEVYIKLHATSEARSIDRVHFLSLAARAMRQILVDHARGRSRLKRGGAVTLTGLNENSGSEAGGDGRSRRARRCPVAPERNGSARRHNSSNGKCSAALRSPTSRDCRTSPSAPCSATGVVRAHSSCANSVWIRLRNSRWMPHAGSG